MMKRIQLITRGTDRTETLQVGKKKYLRVSNDTYVDWRRAKTNHQVKHIEFDALEALYMKHFVPHFVTASKLSGKAIVTPSSKNNGRFIVSYDKSGAPVIADDNERRRIEAGFIQASNDGRQLLAGVKYVKEQTGWGLKESKLFVDSFMARKRMMQNW